MEETNKPRHRPKRRHFKKGARVNFVTHTHIRTDRGDQVLLMKDGRKIREDHGDDYVRPFRHQCSEEGHYHYEISWETDQKENIKSDVMLLELKEGEDGLHTPYQLIVEFDESAGDDEKKRIRASFNVLDPPKPCPNPNIELWEWEPNDIQSFQEAKEKLNSSKALTMYIGELVENIKSGKDEKYAITVSEFIEGAHKENSFENFLVEKIKDFKEKKGIPQKIKYCEDNFVQPISVIEHGDHSSGKSHIEHGDHSSGQPHVEHGDHSSGQPHVEDSHIPGWLEIDMEGDHFPELPPEEEFPNLSEKMGSGEKLIAILDTGIFYESDPHAQRSFLTSIGYKNVYQFDKEGKFGYNFVDDNSLPFDDNGHGTEVANIILGGENKTEGIRILPVKTHDHSGTGLLFDCICGIYYAIEKGADVINLSWGFGMKVGKPSYFLKKAVKAAKDNGILVITSAGNYGENNDKFHHYPSNLSSEFENVIAVGGMKKNGVEMIVFDENLADIDDPAHAHGGSYGEDTVQIGAIGEGYFPVYPAYVLKGASYATARVTNAVGRYLIESDGFDNNKSLRQSFLNFAAEDVHHDENDTAIVKRRLKAEAWRNEPDHHHEDHHHEDHEQ